MLKNVIHLASGVVLSCLACITTAQTQNPFLPWRTLDTEHFHIHFLPQNEAAARQLAAIAEQQYRIATRAFDWQPDRRTHVRLVDNSDRPQGHANVIPYAQSEILLAPPDDGELVSNDDWLTLVFSHELAHVIHLDKSRGTPHGLQDLFGRHPWLFPARMQPGWGVEGIAVYWESLVNAQGRASSPWFDMLMRLEVAHGTKPIEQINNPPYAWPRNQAYLYGSYFYEFLAAQYGEKAIFALVDEYSDNLVPYRLVSNSAHVTGKPLPQLWQQFDDWLALRFRPQIDALQQQGLSMPQTITSGGFVSDNPLQATDGALWFIENDGKNSAQLVRLHNGVRKPVAHVNTGARFTLHPVQGALLAQPELCDAFSVYYDLFRISPITHQLTRLTKCGRYRLAVWSDDGRHIYAVRHEGGIATVVVLDQNGQPQRELLRAHQGEIIGAIDQRGDRIVVTRQRDQQWDIYEIDVGSGVQRQLTADTTIERNVRYNADGSLIYSADYSGNFEIHRLDTNSRTVTQLTRGLGAAISPSPANADGSFYYAGFDANGQNIKRGASAVLASGTLPPVSAAATPATHPRPEPLLTLPTRRYNGIYSIAPTSWEPAWQSSDDTSAIGATVFGQDALALHQYQLTLLRETDLDEYFGSISYVFAQQLFLSTTRDVEGVTTGDDDIEQYKTEIESQMLYSYPFGTLDGLWRAGVGYSFEKDELKSRDGSIADIRENVLGLHASFSSVEYFPLLYGPSNGRSVGLVVESYDAVNNPDYRGEVATLDWHEYIDLDDSTLALRWVEGIGSESPSRFELGDVFSEYEGLLPYINQRQYALRGYSGQRALRGRHLRLGTLEWRLPLRHVNRSLMVPPVGIGRTSMVIFADSGATWHDGGKPDRYYTGAGIELIGELVLGYNLVLDTRIGAARGFADIGESQFYVRIGRAF